MGPLGLFSGPLIYGGSLNVNFPPSLLCEAKNFWPNYKCDNDIYKIFRPDPSGEIGCFYLDAFMELNLKRQCSDSLSRRFSAHSKYTPFWGMLYLFWA